MTYRHQRPAEPPLLARAVVLRGHRPQPYSDAYRGGISRYRCTCGFLTWPAPPTIAAALWREHLEIIMPKGNDEARFADRPLVNAGRSIIEIIWEEMDAVYARLMAGDGARAKGDKGRAAGLAYALAVMYNPYEPNVEAVREAAHARWESGLDEEDLARYEG